MPFSRGDYTFTYNGPIDTNAYSLENALGLVELELPDGRERYTLLDLTQGPRLDQALSLMRPPQQTDEQAAASAGKRRERESYATEDLGLLPARKGPRPAPTQRVRS